MLQNDGLDPLAFDAVLSATLKRLKDFGVVNMSNIEAVRLRMIVRDVTEHWNYYASLLRDGLASEQWFFHAHLEAIDVWMKDLYGWSVWDFGTVFIDEDQVELFRLIRESHHLL